ncbi:MAG: phage holin family protein [bacterium]|nr:phage holin family protein [Alphaproteobacteria bacterium]MDI1366505.1 phage holin family protein [bacterium]
MVRFLFRVLFAAVGLYIAARLVPGIAADGWKTLLIAGLLLGVVNAVVKPIVVLLTFPITLLTLGLFLLVVNGAMLGLVAWLLDGLVVKGLIPGMLGAIVVGVVSWAGQVLIGDGRTERE